MLYVCATRFDMMGNLENFLNFGAKYKAFLRERKGSTLLGGSGRGRHKRGRERERRCCCAAAAGSR